MTTPPLTGAQRRRLRGIAHGLKPLVQIGAAGRSESLDRAIDRALASHELVKIRFLEHKEKRREIANGIAVSLGAELVGLVGHVATLYRAAAEPHDRRVLLD